MKNIHILPTTQPSKLYLGNNGLLAYGFTQTSIQSANEDFTNQFLYITNDEEIKDGDYYINFEEGFGPKSYKYKDYGVESLNINNYNCKKIILTNDPLLIKDGVQPIDDSFLKWFVENPYTEYVEVRKEMYMPFDGIVPMEISLDQSLNTRAVYKIINEKESIIAFEKGQKYINQDGVVILAAENKTDGIVIFEPHKMFGIGHYCLYWNPKAFKLYEEPKQETLQEDHVSWELAKNLFTEIYGYPPKIIQGNQQHEIIVAALQKGMVYGSEYSKEELQRGITITGDKPKEETLEEATENKKNLYYYKQVMNPYSVEEYSHTAYEKGFIEGYQESTKYQEKRMYSEEEVLTLLHKLAHDVHINQWNSFEKVNTWFEEFKKNKLAPSV